MKYATIPYCSASTHCNIDLSQQNIIPMLLWIFFQSTTTFLTTFRWIMPAIKLYRFTKSNRLFFYTGKILFHIS